MLRDDPLALLAQPIDTESDLLARSKINWRLLAESNARRCSGQNEVSWLETHTPTQVTHEEGNAEHHRPRCALLKSTAVYVEPQVQFRSVGHFVGGSQPWTNRAERVGAFTFGPLTCRSLRSNSRMLATTADRSRIAPEASSIPGFSCLAGPYRRSFISLAPGCARLRAAPETKHRLGHEFAARAQNRAWELRVVW